MRSQLVIYNRKEKEAFYLLLVLLSPFHSQFMVVGGDLV